MPCTFSECDLEFPSVLAFDRHLEEHDKEHNLTSFLCHLCQVGLSLDPTFYLQVTRNKSTIYVIAFEFIFCATSWIGLNQVKSYLIWKHCILGSVVDPNYNNSHPEPAPDLNLTVQYLGEKN